MTIDPSFKKKELKFLEKKGKKIINLGIEGIKTMKKASENENANKLEKLNLLNSIKFFSILKLKPQK